MLQFFFNFFRKLDCDFYNQFLFIDEKLSKYGLNRVLFLIF